MESFENLGLSEQTLRVIQKKGFEEPTPIQEKVIPAMLIGNKDIVGQAQTGTGKTAAFGLPFVELLSTKVKTVQALVLTPTRELAIQVAEEINSLKGNKKLSIIPVYGGQSIEIQLRSLKKGVDIVVGTPGRVLDHIRRKTLKLKNISYLVLDEADEMLNMGFIDDVKDIMDKTNHDKKTMLFSATMPQEILGIAEKYMNEYDLFKVSKGGLTVSQTDQIYFEVSTANRFEALCRIIDVEEEFYGLIFCRTKINVDNISNRLMERGYDADGLHGDMSQSMREKILNKFKKKRINILAATDVAARGIDVQDLTHVINYALPQDPEAYVHRIGRTGRAGKGGNAITFITPSEYKKLQFIMKKAGTDIRRAELPDVRDVINIKKLRIRAIVEDIITKQPHKEYLKMAREFLEYNDPEYILAALLQESFQDELNVKNYSQIKDVVVDTGGKTRLFVAQGRKDGLTPEKLMKFIRNKCGLPRVKIKNIEILEKFSFISLPFNEAEILLSYFKKRPKGKQKSSTGPFITKAKKARK